MKMHSMHLLTRPQACPLTGAKSLCALLWLARVFVTVCAGGVMGAARRERRTGEPAQQAALTECMEACDDDDSGEPSWDTDKVKGQVVCWMDSIYAVFPAMICA